jgi:thymidylate synthase (FAD)
MEENKLTRTFVKNLDEILGLNFKVLDDGFIRVVDYMGSDESIVQAARVSYGKGTKKVNEDRGLLRYLLRHNHTTPFEMCEIKLHIRVPMDCWRQWIRHRTANINEYSTRYSIAIDSVQKTMSSEWRMQSDINKQGSKSNLDKEVGIVLSQKELDLHNEIRSVYEERINLGVAREQARKDLPLATYTEAYWKIDLHNLFHFLALRMDSHAQHEIRSYASIIGNEIVSRWCPLAWEAFNDYKLNAKTMSSIELAMIKFIIANDIEAANKYAIEKGLLIKNKEGNLSKGREIQELEIKLDFLGISSPWQF